MLLVVKCIIFVFIFLGQRMMPELMKGPGAAGIIMKTRLFKYIENVTSKN